MKYQRTKFGHFLILVFLLLSVFPLHAEEAVQKIVIKVEGLYCPFCAYGLEKHLKKLKGYKKVEVNLKHGVAELYIKRGMTVTDSAIQQAVEDAGFDSASIKRLENRDKP
ncbi:MAG: heavy-metal-associated domain-containing protein [Nitrospinae bacterium]|nr:heavy-metal-associated domain-containing protein [Nitrospinota bacterium]